MNRMRVVAGVTCVAAAGVLASQPQAFSTFASWPSTPVVFYANPANADVTSTAAENAFKTGMNVWNTQAHSGFRYTYGGRVRDTTTGYDNRNVMLFRDASSGSALATTYSWWSGTTLVDSDIVVWDEAFHFYTGSSGCSNGAYLEDVLTHELGHALGLNHSDNTAATMYPSYRLCSTGMRTLSADDISAAQSLYGTATAGTNTAPSVKISSPVGGTFETTTPIAFAGSATDSEDGNLTSRLSWRSTVSGYLGTGGSFSRTLSAGTHVIVATATDSDGLSASTRVTITVSAPTSTGGTTQPTLTTRGYAYQDAWRVDLNWKGFTSHSVDVFRNGVRYTTTTNDGATKYTVTKAGTYRWKVCASGTSTCSNQTSVTF
jgi:hypothetical protein